MEDSQLQNIIVTDIEKGGFYFEMWFAGNSKLISTSIKGKIKEIYTLELIYINKYNLLTFFESWIKVIKTI